MRIKYGSEDNSNVTIYRDENDVVFNVTPSSWMWEQVEDFVKSGGTIEPYKTTEDLLVERKTELYILLEQKSKEEELTPVPIGPYTFRGGEDSGYALKAWLDGAIYYRDKMPELEITTVDFYDVYGNKVVVPIESDTDLDAWEICMAVRNNAGAILFKYSNLKKLVYEAQSLQEIDAIMNILLGQEHNRKNLK